MFTMDCANIGAVGTMRMLGQAAAWRRRLDRVGDDERFQDRAVIRSTAGPDRTPCVV
jgi:hypothetical protein